MMQLRKVVLAVLLLEIIGFGVAWKKRQKIVQLPQTDWRLSMIDKPAAAEIQELETRMRADKPEQWLNLAETYRAFGLFPQADFCYRKLDGLSPKDKAYLYYWACLLDLMGQTRAASKKYEKVIQLGIQPEILGAQTSAYCWMNIGQDRLREENVAAAETALRKAIELPKAKVLLSRVLVRAGRSAEANQLLDEALRQTPDLIDAIQMKSRAEAELGHGEVAEQLDERALRSQAQVAKWDPTYQPVLRRRKAMGSQAWHEKSLELEAAGQLEMAKEWSRKALAAFWTEERAQQLAKLELRTNHPEEARRLADDCVRQVGASALTMDIIGVSSIKLGDKARAQRAWELAVQLEPTPELYNKLGEVQRAAGNTAEVQRYQSLAEYQRGKNAWLRNDLRAALEHLQRAVGHWDGHAPTWYYLGDTLRNLGNIPLAAQAYRRCLEVSPDHGRARRALKGPQFGNG